MRLCMLLIDYGIFVAGWLLALLLAFMLQQYIAANIPRFYIHPFCVYMFVSHFWFLYGYIYYGLHHPHRCSKCESQLQATSKPPSHESHPASPC